MKSKTLQLPAMEWGRPSVRRRIRALVVDDEPPARSRVIELLRPVDDFVVIGECSNGREALHAIAADPPDVVFLDVQMPLMSGMEVVAAMGIAAPRIVFMTAYEDYAVTAFEANALDYLLKPFDNARFRTTLDRVRFSLSRASQDTHEFEPQDHADSPFLQRVVVRNARRYDFLDANDIETIESARNYLRLTIGSRVHLHRGKLTDVLQRLDPRRFIRVHRSIAVNARFIRAVQPWNQTDFKILLKSGHTITSGRLYRSNVARLVKTTRG